MVINKVLRSGVLPAIILAASALILSCSPPAATHSTGTPPAAAGATITPTVASGNDLTFLVGSDPAKIDNSRLPVTPVDYLHVTGTVTDIDIEKYRLAVDGLVDNWLNLTYEEIKQFPAVTETVLLICPGFFVDNAEWTGVPVTTLLEEAGIQGNASEITFYQSGRYQKSFPLADMENDGVFLAYLVNGQVLPEEHGYPLRLVARGEYGNLWVKWVDRIEIK